MTVHCVEIKSSTDVDVVNVGNKISDLKSKYGEKLSKQDNGFTKVEPYFSSTNYYSAVFRVSLSQGSKATEKNDLTEQIRKEMDKSASWWQIRWHECSHDENAPSDCSWEYQNDSGNVPAEVS